MDGRLMGRLLAPSYHLSMYSFLFEMHASMRGMSQHHNSTRGKWNVQVKLPSTTEKKWHMFFEHSCQNTSSQTYESLNASHINSTFHNHCWCDPKPVSDQRFKLHWSIDWIWNDRGIVSTIQTVIPLVNPSHPKNIFLKEIHLDLWNGIWAL